MIRESGTGHAEQGLSLIGFMFVAAIVAVIAVLAMKVVPSVVEYSAIKKALVQAKDSGSTPSEIRGAFDRQASSGYIDSVAGRDLEVEKTDQGYQVSVAYQKKIALIGPASLVIDYVATTNGEQVK